MIPQGNSICFLFPISSLQKCWKRKRILSRILNVYSKEWLLIVILQRYICYCGNLLNKCSSIPFTTKSLSSRNFREMLPVIFSPKKYYSLEYKNTFCNTECHSKTTIKSNREKHAFFQKQKKGVQNSARSRNLSCWCHLVQGLITRRKV